jgi:hypothetical protein
MASIGTSVWHSDGMQKLMFYDSHLPCHCFGISVNLQIPSDISVSVVRFVTCLQCNYEVLHP